MSFLLSSTTNLTCTMGLTPSPLNILPVNAVFGQFLPLATMMDNKPLLNIMPFGLCKSPANPMVAAIIASSLGAVTQGPCIPATFAPWVSSKPVIMIKNFPCITINDQLICSYGGMIKAVAPSQTAVMC